MSSIGDRVYDEGLDLLDTNGNRLDICDTEPTTYTEAITTFSLGNKIPPVISAPTDRAGGGREVDISAITDGTVDATGTASFWAIVDTVGTDLLATGDITTPQDVTSGNPFTLTAFKIGFPDPA